GLPASCPPETAEPGGKSFERPGPHGPQEGGSGPSSPLAASRHAAASLRALRGDSLRRRMSLCDMLERVSAEAVQRPVLLRHGAERAIERRGRLIPVEDCPIEPAAAAFDCQSSQCGQQCLAVTVAPVLRPDEQILQVNSRLAEKRREIVEKERETDDLV